MDTSHRLEVISLPFPQTRPYRSPSWYSQGTQMEPDPADSSTGWVPAVDTVGVRTWATQAPEGPWPPPDADFPHRPSSHLPPPQSALIRKVINSSFSLCVPFNREPLCLRQSQKQPVGSGASAVTQIGRLGMRPCRAQASMLFPSSSHHPSPVFSLEIVFIG